MEINPMAVYRATEQWEREAPIELILDIHAYRKHFKDQYGICLDPRIGGMDHTIIDEKKYMLFLLRWS